MKKTYIAVQGQWKKQHLAHNFICESSALSLCIIFHMAVLTSQCLFMEGALQPAWQSWLQDLLHASCSLPVQARGLVLCLLSFKLAFLQTHWQWGQASLTVPSAMLAWADSPFKCTWQHDPHSWSNGRRGGLFVVQGRRGDASSGQQWGQGSSKGMQSLGPGGRRRGYREGRRKVPLTRWVPCTAQRCSLQSVGGWTLISACRLSQCQQMKSKIHESVRFLTYLILCWGSKRPLMTLCLELQSDIRGFVLWGSSGVLLYWSVF